MDKIECITQRRYDRSGAAWLITLMVGHDHGLGGGGTISGYPQTHAVVDDFGTLVAVSRKWNWDVGSCKREMDSACDALGEACNSIEEAVTA